MMSQVQKAFLIFFLGCIPVRLSLVYASRKLSKEHLKWMGYLALLPAIGFMYYFFRWSTEKGLALFKTIWWNNMRPIHGLLYFAFAYYAITGNRDYAWKILTIDVIIGIIAFLTRYYSVLKK